jgi:hypothetical protein
VFGGIAPDRASDIHNPDDASNTVSGVHPVFAETVDPRAASVGTVAGHPFGVIGAGIFERIDTDRRAVLSEREIRTGGFCTDG